MDILVKTMKIELKYLKMLKCQNSVVGEKKSTAAAIKTSLIVVENEWYIFSMSDIIFFSFSFLIFLPDDHYR